MNNETGSRFTDPDLWIRAVYMIVFALLSALSRLITLVVAGLQFLVVLVSGVENRNLRDFGYGLAVWTRQTYLFLTFNSEKKPFPFQDWPVPEADGSSADTDASVAGKAE